MTIIEIYQTLHDRYGNLNWWPASSLAPDLRAFEVMVGAILTQNTAWSNVEKAIANFNGKLSPELIENLSTDEMTEIIRPAGFFNQKAAYLKTLTQWYKKYDYNVETVKQHELHILNEELLSLKGIGPETADSILLYAFGFPTFVVDAYTKRLLTRLNIGAEMDYNTIKTLFEANINKDIFVYNNFHACIVINAKEYCKAKPTCNGCPLENECKYREELK